MVDEDEGGPILGAKEGVGMSVPACSWKSTPSIRGIVCLLFPSSDRATNRIKRTATPHAYILLATAEMPFSIGEMSRHQVIFIVYRWNRIGIVMMIRCGRCEQRFGHGGLGVRIGANPQTTRFPQHRVALAIRIRLICDETRANTRKRRDTGPRSRKGKALTSAAGTANFNALNTSMAGIRKSTRAGRAQRVADGWKGDAQARGEWTGEPCG